jgi:hypothetical protein
MNPIETFGTKKLKGKKLDKEIDFLALSTDDSKGYPTDNIVTNPKID